MELIFYDEAARLLDVSIGSLAHAVSRGELTKAGLLGTKQRLIKEQVMLFRGTNPRTGGKKRISYNSLTSQEQAIWNRYADELASPERKAISDDVKKTLAELVKEELARQELARLQAEEKEAQREAQRRQAEKERIFKDNPFLMRELMTA